MRGSAPRPFRARFCVTRSGKMAGSVSGGCVENDVFEHALRVLDDGRPALVHYGAADESGLRGGARLRRLDRRADRAVRADGGLAGGARGARATAGARRPVRRIWRRTPCSGASSRCSADGGLRGLRRSRPGRAAGRGGGTPASRGRRDGARTPLARRGGRASSSRPFRPPLRLFIVGATHTAIPLCRMAKQLGFRVSVIDVRSAFATEERFPEADELVRAWPDEALERRLLDAADHVVTLTHDPKFDLPALALRPAFGGRLHRRPGQPAHPRAARRRSCGSGASARPSWRASTRRSGSTSAAALPRRSRSASWPRWSPPGAGGTGAPSSRGRRRFMRIPDGDQ